MTRIHSTHQLEGLITLDNKKCIAVFSDFDSAVLFRAHHPAWEVHIHLIIPRSPKTPPTSATVINNSSNSMAFVPNAQRDARVSSAYLTDGETIYKQAIFTAEQLGIANDQAQSETQGALYWETHYRVVEEALLTNPNSLA